MMAKLIAVIFIPMASAAIAGEIARATAIALVLLLLSAICFPLCSPRQGGQRWLGREPFNPVEVGPLDFLVSLILAAILQIPDSKATFIILAAFPGFYKLVLPGMLNTVMMREREHAEAQGQVIEDGFGLLDVMVSAVLSILVQFQGEEHRTAVRVAFAVIPVAYKIILPGIFNFAMGILEQDGVQPWVGPLRGAISFFIFFAFFWLQFLMV